MKKQRDHKFQVWDREKKRMSRSVSLFTPMIAWQDGSQPTAARDIFFQDAVGRDRYEFRQGTSCKDKNGVTMFEWDIVRAHGVVGTIQWHEQLAMFELVVKDYIIADGAVPEDGSMTIYSRTNDQGWYMEREVLGNVYQHAELLLEPVPVLPQSGHRPRIKRP
jgi:uncharacterized phage protein (TIGR01671 family)